MKISRNFNDMEYEFQLTPDELEVAYRMRLREYQSEDAVRHIGEYCEDVGIDDCSTHEALVAICVERFSDKSDCNIAENDMWHSVVKEAISRYVKSDMESNIMVSRHINGITINAHEYLLDLENGKPMIFKDEDDAIAYLLNHGETQDSIQWYTFKTVAEELRECSIKLVEDGITLEQIAEELEYRERAGDGDGKLHGWDDSLCAFTEAELVYIADYIQTSIKRFAIYQLKDSEETRDIRFESLNSLRSRGLNVDKSNYNHVYSAPLSDGDTLDKIFEKFNIDHPNDFTGHSLSVSDVIVIYQGRNIKIHYVDRIGFTEIPEFFNNKPSQNNSY